MIVAYVVQDEGELLDGGDDDFLPFFDEPAEVTRPVGVSDRGRHLGELPDGPVNLPVQHPPVGDDDDGVEGGFSFVFHSYQLPCHPGDGVGLSAAGRVLDQVFLSSALILGVHQEFPHHIELVIPGPYLPVVRLLGVVFKDVGESVGGEYLLPEVGGLHPARVDGVAGAAVLLALVEGQEVRRLALQFCAELDLFIVDGEVDGAPAQPEEVLLRTSGRFVLLHGVGDCLACEPVLQLHRDDWQAVHEQGDVQGQLLVAGAVPELPGDGEPVLPVAIFSLGVARGGSPIEEGYLAGPVLDTLPEYVDDAPAGDLPFEAVQEPSSRGGICVSSDPVRPLFQAGLLERKVERWLRSTQWARS